MEMCWEIAPKARPTFSELVTSIKAHAGNLTGDMNMSELTGNLD